MTYTRLWVLVEGNDDERFFEAIIKPKLRTQYSSVQLWQYAQETPKRTRNFLKSIRAMSSDYYFFSDINRSPCITAKKRSTKRRYDTRIDINTIIVVVREIESWYLAGLNSKSCKELGLRTFRRTDSTTKEQFNSLMPEKFDSRIDFMVEILKRFSIQTAKRKNRSFAYFMKKI